MKPLFLVAWICGQNLATGAWDRDCQPYEERAANAKDCEQMAQWLNSISPAGVRVIAWGCVFGERRNVS